MSDREHHCPFLNRADHRCSSFFSIEGLQHAFEHCFNAYKACGVYDELLLERQARRGQCGGSRSGGSALWTTACKPAESHVTTTVAAKFVQVRLPSVATGVQQAAPAGSHGYAKPIA